MPHAQPAALREYAKDVFRKTRVGAFAAMGISVIFIFSGLYGPSDAGTYSSRWSFIPFAVFVALTIRPAAKLLWGRVGPRGVRRATWFAQCVRVFAFFIWASVGLCALIGSISQMMINFAVFVLTVSLFRQARDEWKRPKYANMSHGS